MNITVNITIPDVEPNDGSVVAPRHSAIADAVIEAIQAEAQEGNEEKKEDLLKFKNVSVEVGGWVR